MKLMGIYTLSRAPSIPMQRSRRTGKVAAEVKPVTGSMNKREDFGAAERNSTPEFLRFRASAI